jgi:hypothetical protein
MTDKDVIERAAGIINGPVSLMKDKRPNRKDMWRTHIHGDKAFEVMKRILPFMGYRRKQKIEYLLERAKHRMTPHQKGVAGNAKRWGLEIVA